MTTQDNWTREELQTWLQTNLSTNTDRKRWILFGFRLLKGLPIEPDELLGEAVARALGGIRNFNRQHPIEANLYETMRSIVSSWHKTRKRKPEISLEDLIDSDDGDLDPLEVLVTPKGVYASPEEELIFKEEMTRILKLFEDREDAQMVLIGRGEGLKGAALAEVADIDPTKLPSVLRLISRRLAGYRREA